MSDKEVAVVTGGARGIGLALADGAARRGMKVAVIDLDPEAVDEAVQSLRDRWGSNVIGFAADVTDEQEVADYVGSVERSLGAITSTAPTQGCSAVPGVGTAEEWQSLWGVHVLANVYVARTVAPLMVKRGKDNRDVSVGSRAAHDNAVRPLHRHEARGRRLRRMAGGGARRPQRPGALHLPTGRPHRDGYQPARWGGGGGGGRRASRSVRGGQRCLRCGQRPAAS